MFDVVLNHGFPRYKSLKLRYFFTSKTQACVRSDAEDLHVPGLNPAEYRLGDRTPATVPESDAIQDKLRARSCWGSCPYNDHVEGVKAQEAPSESRY